MAYKIRITVCSIIVMLGIFFLEEAQGALPNFVPLVKDVGKAVVNISTEKKVSQSRSFFPMEMFRGLPPGFERFFEQFERPPNGYGQKQRALGTGFIISQDGYIVTNNHVIEGADTVKVSLESQSGTEESFHAEVVGTDEETDIALLKVKTNNTLPYLSFGDSDTLEVGEWVLAIGNPFGLGHTVTSGIISAKGRNINSGPFDSFLQTNASINPGNSGGPLINMSGQVVGVNTAIVSGGQGIGFAIPSNMVNRIVLQLKNDKKVSRGWIGVSIQDVDRMTAKALGLKEGKGALVSSVMPGEPAEKAGLQAGDVVVSADGKNINNANELLLLVTNKNPDSSLNLTVWRNGKIKKFVLVLGERNSASKDKNHQDSNSSSLGSIGLSARSLTKEEAEFFYVKKGGLVVTYVDASKSAAEVGIIEGDIILSANLKPLAKSTDLSKILESDGKKNGAVLLQIQRNGQVFFKTLSLE